MVELLSKRNAVVLCGAPNLSFLAGLPSALASMKLPLHRTQSAAATTPTPVIDTPTPVIDTPTPVIDTPPPPAALDTSAIYLAFLSNEGDTPKNAYSFRAGNWLLPRTAPAAATASNRHAGTAAPAATASNRHAGTDDDDAADDASSNSNTTTTAATAMATATISWGSQPLVGRLFPALWEYYVATAAPQVRGLVVVVVLPF
jgi:hypothetical protein